MTKSGSKSDYQGMTLLLPNRRRLTIVSQNKPEQKIIIWTDPNDNLKAEINLN